MSNAKTEREGIAVAGSLIADVFYKIDTFPEEGRLTNIRDASNNTGGTGNIILDLAKLDQDLRVEAVALVGRDDGGEMILNEFSKYPNIDTAPIKRTSRTSSTIVMNAQDTKQRTFFYLPGASDEFDIDCIDWDALHAKIFLLEYLLLMKKVDSSDDVYGTHGAKILQTAKSKGFITAIDVVSEQSQRAKDVVSAALKYTDICSINEIEAEAITGYDLTSSAASLEENAEKALASIKESGVSKWVVIHSPLCGYGLDCETNKFVKVNSVNLPDGFIKGSNGAGDAYYSGIIFSYNKGEDIEEAMRFATKCAACSLSEENGTDGLRPYQVIKQMKQEDFKA